MSSFGHFPLTLSMPTWTLQWPVYIGYADTHVQSDCALHYFIGYKSAPFLCISVEFVVKITETTYSILCQTCTTTCALAKQTFFQMWNLCSLHIYSTVWLQLSVALMLNSYRICLCVYVYAHTWIVSMCVHKHTHTNKHTQTYTHKHACLCTPHILVCCVCHQHIVF